MRRLPAEWEPQSAIQFTFPHADSDWAPILPEVQACFARIIEAVTRFQKAVVVCTNRAETAKILEACQPENLVLVELPSNDTWARDHGGIFIEENGELVLLDFMFNGWGLKFAANADNQITQALHEKGIFGKKKHHKPELVLEGGGIESDGLGTLLTTTECLLSPNRNPHFSKKQIENRLKKWLGAHRVLWLESGYLAGDDTDSHIDTLARFCNPQTICYVQCRDTTDEHFDALKRMEDELKAFRQADSTPYKLVALPFPEAIFDEEGQRLPATYANFLILNGAVLVPTYNVPQDAEALKVLKQVFPDHTIIGLDCRPLIWQHGSLHCITMQFPKGALAR
jgi:agmatine deiminase